MKPIYFDHNATTQVDKKVIDAMLPYYEEGFGNASSVHEFGRKAKMGLEASRQKVAKAIGAADLSEIVFTSGGTESDNFAIKGICQANKAKGRHIITTSVEHSAILNTCKFLEKEGFSVTYLPVDQYGVLDLNALKNAINDKTVLISVILANNETGTIQPITEISKIVKEKGVLLHTDAVQAVGKIPINVQDMGIDLLSMSAHKIYGPKGVGALYIKKGTKISIYQHGGHHERKRRAGTENVPGIVGFGQAIEMATANMEKDYKYVSRLRDSLYKGITDKIKHARLNGHKDARLPNTVNVGFKYLEGESILLNLDMEGIAVSTGSACTSGSLEASHVLTSMNVDPADAQGSIRFSLGKGNTQAEIDYCLQVLPSIIERLRKMSPLYTES